MSLLPQFSMLLKPTIIYSVGPPAREGGVVGMELQASKRAETEMNRQTERAGGMGF